MNTERLTNALALHRAGRWADAEAEYRAILAQYPHNLSALKLLGVLLAQTKRPHLAESLLRQAAALAPDDADLLSNWGAALVDCGSPALALTILQQATTKAPQSVSAWVNLARASLALGDYIAAETSRQTALALNPMHGLAQELGVEICLLTDRPTEAITLALATLKHGHDSPNLRANLAAAYLKQTLYQHAHDVARDGLIRWPHAPALLAAFGAALEELQQRGSGIAYLHKAVELQPKMVEAWITLAGSYYAIGQDNLAIQAAQHALTLQPNNHAARLNLALPLLAQGMWAEGFAAFEARRNQPQTGLLSASISALKCPPWQGEPVAGRHILLMAEQGLGDTLQFCRYAILLTTLGAQVTLAPQPRLIPLFQGLSGLTLTTNPQQVQADVGAPLMSVPHFLAQNRPHSQPAYLLAPNRPALVERQPGKMMVGLAWQGNPQVRVDRGRSMALTTLAPLLTLPHIHAVSLQQGTEQTAGLHLPPSTVDAGGAFVDTAAIMVQSLDLVITTDTAIAHLAGTLGVRCWVMLQSAPDWRWGRAGQTTPWYPTIRLFRQTQPGDWDSVVAAIQTALTTDPSPIG